MLLYEHWGFLSFYISHSLLQKQRSFGRRGEGCKPASLLGESSEKDPWDFQSLSFLLSSGGLWRDDFGFFPFHLLLNSISSPPNDFICISNGWVLILPAPCSSSGASSLLQYWDSSTRQLFGFLLPLTLLIFLSLGVVLTCSLWSENWIKPQWCSGEWRAGWEGVGVCYSSVSHLVVTIYCIFYFFFFSVAVLLIYQMVQMFWHNYFSLHYLFMMLFVIVFYTFGIINYVHVKISISKKSVTRGQKNSWFIFSQNLFPAYWIGWIFFKYVANHNAILLPPNNCVLFNNVLVA